MKTKVRCPECDKTRWVKGSNNFRDAESDESGLPLQRCKGCDDEERTKRRTQTVRCPKCECVREVEPQNVRGRESDVDGVPLYRCKDCYLVSAKKHLHLKHFG